jgi:hypothetical protein
MTPRLRSESQKTLLQLIHKAIGCAGPGAPRFTGPEKLKMPCAVSITPSKSRAMGDEGEISIWLFLAMAHSKAGHRVEAQEWLDKARPWLAARIPELQSKAGAAAPVDGGVNNAVESSVPPEKANIGVQPLSRDEIAAFKRLLFEAETELGKAGS